MKVLVTGANGMLGQDLCPILEDCEFDVIETDIDTMDITDKKSVEKVLDDYEPDVVIHCAAYTNVDKAEDEENTARKIKTEGSANIAEICNKKDITLVYISTDYVFDGTKKGKYLPNDKPCPINAYGRTKLEGEEAIKKCKKSFHFFHI